MNNLVFVLIILAVILIPIILVAIIQWHRVPKATEKVKTKYRFMGTPDYPMGELKIENVENKEVDRFYVQQRGAVRLSQGWILSEEQFRKIREEELKHKLP